MTQRKAPLTALIGRRNGMYFVRKQRPPLSADTGEKIGCIWLDMVGKIAYILSSNANNIAKWEKLGTGLYFQKLVLSKATAQAGATQTEGFRYISPAAGASWSEDNIYEWHAGAWVETTAIEGMAVYIDDIDEMDLFDGTDWNNLVSPVTTLAGLTDTTIAGLADGNMLIYDTGTSKWFNKAVSGVITIADTGLTSFSGTPVTNAFVNAAAAIAWSKMAAVASASIVLGSAGNVATVTAVTGDMAISNTGLTTVTDLTIASEAQGDILYFDGTNWVRLAAGTTGLSLLSNGAAANPSWGSPPVASATSLANGCTLNDAGALDAILAFTTQTVAAPTLTIPDFASVSDEFVFKTFTQTLVNKTLTAPDINGGTADSLTGFSIRSSGAAFDLEQDTAEVLTGNKIISWNVGDTNRSITLGGNIALGGTLTTLGAWTQTGAHTIGITTTGATTVTLPVAGILAATTAAGTAGQVIIGATGATGEFATIGHSAGSLTSTAGVNTLNIDTAESMIRTATVAVSSGEIKALNAAPKELIAAPGAGKYIDFLGAVIALDYGTVTYDDAGADGNLQIRYDAATVVSLTVEGNGLIDATEDAATTAKPLATDVTMLANKKIELFNDAAEYTGGAGGDGVLKVIINYRILDLS